MSTRETTGPTIPVLGNKRVEVTTEVTGQCNQVVSLESSRRERYQ